MNHAQSGKTFARLQKAGTPAEAMTAVVLDMEPDLVTARSLAALIHEALSTDKPIPEELRDGWCHGSGELCAALDGAYGTYRQIEAARRSTQN